MLHVIKSADRFDRYRAVAPWIRGFEEQLGAAMRLRPQEGAWGTLIPGLAAARRRATLTRWRNGPLAWRKWADGVQALQAEPAPDPEAARFLAWLAYCDFSRHAFLGGADFSGADFPAGASFEGATFLGEAWFSGATFAGRTWFGQAIFTRDALFETCWFGAAADFSETRFAGSARFSSSIALAGFVAARAQFQRDFWARAGQFLGPVVFAKARITGEAGWGHCNFAEACDFSHVEFGDNAGFEDTVFSGEASFEHAAFAGNARFTRARFAVQPRFKAARFFRAGRFDDSQIPLMTSTVVDYRAEIERRFRTHVN